MDERTLSDLAGDALTSVSGAVVAVREHGTTAVGTAGEGMDPSARFQFGSIGRPLRQAENDGAKPTAPGLAAAPGLLRAFLGDR